MNSSGGKQYNPTQNTMKKTGGGYKENEATSLNVLSIKDGGMNSSNSASLKGKVGSLEDSTNEIANEINAHRNEIGNLRNEKDSLKESIENRTKEVRSTLFQEIDKIDDEITRHINGQKAEGSRLQQQILSLKTEKTQLAKELSTLQNRLKEIESQIGFDDVKEI
mmetsp:Transcript_9596/g.9903  ORF Transcript_9596/g.9903 Transcript_9596/m.9903 type:complete len:165 (-) Transcript_9596:111-605(-)